MDRRTLPINPHRRNSKAWKAWEEDHRCTAAPNQQHGPPVAQPNPPTPPFPTSMWTRTIQPQAFSTSPLVSKLSTTTTPKMGTPREDGPPDFIHRQSPWTQRRHQLHPLRAPLYNRSWQQRTPLTSLHSGTGWTTLFWHLSRTCNSIRSTCINLTTPNPPGGRRNPRRHRPDRQGTHPVGCQ